MYLNFNQSTFKDFREFLILFKEKRFIRPNNWNKVEFFFVLLDIMIDVSDIYF